MPLLPNNPRPRTIEEFDRILKSTTRPAKKISVIMPAYNEAQHIAKNVRETVQTFLALHMDFEVIVVDDGSPDHTWLAALEVLPENEGHVRVVRYDGNRGKGNAVMAGSAYAAGGLLAFIDADMDLHPSQLERLVLVMERENADIVIGSKRHLCSDVDYPLIRKIWSTGYYYTVRALFGLNVRDTQTGIKLFTREVIEQVFPRVVVKRFAFDLEVLANAVRLGFKIAEAPIRLEFRRSVSRLKWKDVVSVFRDTMAIFYRMHLIHYYDQRVNVPLAHLVSDQGATIWHSDKGVLAERG